jgi:hypothetical protein
MEHGAIDLHKKEGEVRIVTEGAEIIDRRIATTRDRLTAVLGPAAHACCSRPRPRVSGSRGTETLGHEVIVADPNFTAMYGHRSRRHQDGSTRCGRVGGGVSPGCYRVVHRRLPAQRLVQAQLNIRRERARGRSR